MCRIFGALKEEPANSKWLDLYYRELQIELNAMRQMQEKVVQGVENTMKRGAGAELPSSQSLIAKWLPPLEAAILNEQKRV